MSDLRELSYGEVLRELRIYHDYKQKDISEYLNITSQAYSNYENNKRTPDIETMYKIAHFYKITLDQLISYRYTKQFEDIPGYMNDRTLYRAVDSSGISIPMKAEQAKMITDILSLTPEQQDACQKFVNFLKTPIS
jgi:transcriptional regulator with XRE-family HTH domain